MASPAKSNVIGFGVYEFNVVTGELRKDGMRIRLEGQPLTILQMLLERPGELVTREALQKRLWPGETFVDFEHSLNAGIKRLRAALSDSAEQPRYIETQARRGYRFIAPLDGVVSSAEAVAFAPLANGNNAISPNPPAQSPPATSSFLPRWKFVLPLVAVGTVLAICASLWLQSTEYFWRNREAHAMSETDTVVLADFANSTGNAVFDDTLKQALAVSLRQSPFLKVLSDEKVITTLRQMTLPPNTPLTPKIAREVCQRAESKAYIAGSVASIGNEYVIGLKAVNCESGDTLALEQVHADGKEKILGALDKAAAKLRTELGESLSSVQRFDTPIWQATTSSLDALKAFSLGMKIREENGNLEGIPFLRQAIELDPNFAEAYDTLGGTYATLGERTKSLEYFNKAFQLRDRVTEPEKYDIASTYYDEVTGEIEKSLQVCQLWAKSYPRDTHAHDMLGYNYFSLGQDEKALAEAIESVRLDPDIHGGYLSLIQRYALRNQLAEAKAAYQEGIRRKPDSGDVHAAMYGVAFLERDMREMERQAKLAADEPEMANILFSYQSDTEAFFGHLKKAQEFSERAVQSATLNDLKETAAGWQMNGALREAEFGNSARAQEQSTAALTMSPTRDVQILAALAFARTGDSTRAQRLADEVHKQFPLDTIIGDYWLPTVRAAIEINRNNPSKAIEFLKTATPYELGDVADIEFGAFFYPVYVRGQAYLLLHQGAEAAAEFQKFLDHPTMVANNPLFVLAHLGLARAYTLQGDTDKSRPAYQDFFTLWKDADQDIPILKQARAEYAKLQ